jgi:ribonuclease E
MLIDAAHAEETRVVVVDGSRIEELDFESQSHKQLRGNIYLARVTRVEPSLQAAFIEYGGNRHGFLAFNEIHPDYYQIPVADREALMREEEEEEAKHSSSATEDDSDDEDAMDEVVERRRRRLMRRYKIQEVIKRRQIMLVQVVKEERGNKGAALTSYLSLAGRYCVLMPNTARGGGISRKITSLGDRKRLKSAVAALDLPPGMGLIIRTAGAARTKAEIKRDYEYLLRLWENIREKTLGSIAPALIYEEEDLVKRAIRDMFDKDLESIQVEGDAGYKEARDFMRMIMPSQASKVIHYRDPTPLFVKHQIEDQISQIHSPVVQLKSGGYLVINQTEALVAIDVNSGRSTRERSIEITALKTNIEAAEEAARQLRLRDLAGLIVIDFIDMDEGKNNRHVEKVLKDALKDDRARIQMGKISSFGLMEISRQRRRSGVLEGSTHVCEHCQGMGRVRSVESSAVAALRAIEMESVKGGAGAITVRLPTAVGLYVLNEKRVYLAGLDTMYDLHATIVIDDKLAHAEIEIERTESHEGPPRERPPQTVEPEAEWVPPQDDLDEEEDLGEHEIEVIGEDVSSDAAPESEEGRDRKRRRRRRGGRRDEESADRSEQDATTQADIDAEDNEGGEDLDNEDGEEPRASGDDEGGARRRRRRRGRRGGRRLREETQPVDVYAWTSPRQERTAPLEQKSADPYAWTDSRASAATEFAPKTADSTTPDLAPASGERKRSRGRRRGRGGSHIETMAHAASVSTEDGVALSDAAPTATYAWSDDSSDHMGMTEQAMTPAPVVEAISEPAGEPIPEIAPVQAEAPAKKPRRSRAKAAPKLDPVEAVAEPAADGSVTPPLEPELAVEQPTLAKAPVPAPEPIRTPEPDPAEISAPPAKPRGGWWRKSV